MQFFGTPWKQTVTSVGDPINLWQEIGVEFDIPPGAVPDGKELDLSVWPCIKGPFQLPFGYELASPVFLISPSFQFSSNITLTIGHFSNLETEEDCQTMVFLSAPTAPYNVRKIDNSRWYPFSILGKGVFSPGHEYGQVSLRHFCYATIGCKRKEPLPDPEIPPRKQPKSQIVTLWSC